MSGRWMRIVPKEKPKRLTRYYADLPLHHTDADTRAAIAGSGFVSDFSVPVYKVDEVQAVMKDVLTVITSYQASHLQEYDLAPCECRICQSAKPVVQEIGEYIT